MWLLTAITNHIEASGISESRFGRDALGDPRFVSDLRRGRVPKPRTVARVRAYLEGSTGS